MAVSHTLYKVINFALINEQAFIKCLNNNTPLSNWLTSNIS